MDCVKLYFKDSLIGVLTYNEKNSSYIFVKNKFFTNKYIHDIIGLKQDKEVYASSELFSFFLTFLKRYESDEEKNEFDKLIDVAHIDFDKNQFWIGA